VWEAKDDLDNLDCDPDNKLQEFIDKHGTSDVGNDPDAVYFDPQYVQIDEVVRCVNSNCRHSTLSSISELLETYDENDDDIAYVIRWKGSSQDCFESWNNLKNYANDIFNYWQAYNNNNSSSNSTSVNTKTYGRRTKKASDDNINSATAGKINDDDHDSHSYSRDDEEGDNNDNNDDNDNDNDDDGQYNDRINSQGFPTQESIDLLTQDIFGDMDDDDDEIDDNDILRNTQEYADIDDEDIDTNKKKGSKSKKAIVYKEDDDDEQDDDSLGLGLVDDNDSDYDGPTVKRKSKGRRAKAVDDDDGTGALMNAQKAKAIVNEEVDAITAIDTDSNKPSAARLLTSKWKDDDDDRVEENMALLQESTLKQFEQLGLDLHKQRFELKAIKAWYQSDKDEQSKKWFNEEKKRIFEKMDKKKVPTLLSSLL